jgi:hypothetical protein
MAQFTSSHYARLGLALTQDGHGAHDTLWCGGYGCGPCAHNLLLLLLFLLLLKLFQLLLKLDNICSLL